MREVFIHEEPRKGRGHWDWALVAFTHGSFGGHLFLFLLANTQEWNSWLRGNFIRTCQIAFHGAALYYIPTSSVWVLPDPQPRQHLILSGFLILPILVCSDISLVLIHIPLITNYSLYDIYNYVIIFNKNNYIDIIYVLVTYHYIVIICWTTFHMPFWIS